MTRDPVWVPEPVPFVPTGDDPADELRAELRAAKEQLALMEATETPRGPPRMSGDQIAHPRLKGLSLAQIRAFISRTESDLRDATSPLGFERVQHEEQEDASDG